MEKGIIESTRENSQNILSKIREQLRERFPLENEKYKNICVYACGSLGRLEMSENSDLDLFFVSLHNCGEDPMCQNLNKYKFFSKLYDINCAMEFPEPSKCGEYWEFINKDDFLDIGSRKEDFNNSFTARLLFLLESKPIYNEEAFDWLLKETVSKYFTDYADHRDEFYPLFLINDILRYWYTLTLNYEYRRDDADDVHKKNWKRLKLKYARLLTCFSMIACLYRRNITSEYVVECIKMTPLERLDKVASKNTELRGIVESIKKEYEWFLNLRQTRDNGFDEKEKREEAFRHADKFHELVLHQLLNQVSQANPQLRKRMDLF